MSTLAYPKPIYTHIPGHLYRARLAKQERPTSDSKKSMHVHCGALLFVSQWQCISSSVFYSFLTLDYCSLCCTRLLAQLHFVSARGTTFYVEPLFTSYQYCRHSLLRKICRFLECLWSNLWFPWGQCRSIVVHCCFCHSDSASVLLYLPICTSLCIRPEKMCVYCHMLKKIRVGRSEIFFFLILFFITKLNYWWWHLECITTLEEWHLTLFFCQNNDPLDIKKNKLEGKNRVFK